MEERNRETWSHWGGIAATLWAGGVKKQNKNNNHTFRFCLCDNRYIVPRRSATPADTSHFLQHQDWGDWAELWAQTGLFLHSYISQEINVLQHIKNYSSAKKTSVGMILYRQNATNYFVIYSWTALNLNSDIKAWGPGITSLVWLSFLQTSVQPPFTINKTICIVKEQEFLYTCFEFAVAKRLSRDPKTLWPFRKHIPGGFSAPLGQNLALIGWGGSGLGRSTAHWADQRLQSCGASALVSRCRLLINI